MGKVASAAGRALVAKVLQGIAPTGNYYLRLFQNAVTPGVGDPIGVFTESTFGGYAAITKTWGDNTGPVASGDDQVITMAGDSFVFDCTSAPETIYGWYLVNAATGDWLFAEDYATPHVLAIGTRHRLFLDIGITQP